ncbi:suppressor of cytokine signaling 2-like isoform X1 [Galleria mellonella]|uniref:Suppressor of cytokine signaling 2-like isoform X1 n=1 Tax=Galleria mellonella TaxID=7137 RepID=A0A6J1WHA8_GALME|nr:suppressor of cytokine signaling 2-like isoform X1 [Galleria mellonella]
MCVIQVLASKKNLLNMTLAARLSPHNPCLNVGVPGVGIAASCPTCRNEFLLSLGPITGKWPVHAHTPATSPFTTRPAYSPHSPLYAATCSPFYLPQFKDEIKRLNDTFEVLNLSGWFYERLDLQGAQNLLKDASIGAFLIRRSGDKNFIFSLSVQTDRGPTSVRIHFEDGFFRLDCDTSLVKYMPRFRCVVEMVQHYILVGERGAAGTVWVNREGCPHSPVLLTSPFRKNPPTLKEAARLAIHKALDSNPLKPKLWCAPKHRLLPLPPTLIDYLGKYPYSI